MPASRNNSRFHSWGSPVMYRSTLSRIKPSISAWPGAQTLDDLDIVPDLGVAVQQVVVGDEGEIVLEEEAQPLGEDGVQEHPWRQIHPVVHHERIGTVGHGLLEEALAGAA